MNYFRLELIRAEYKQREKYKWRRNNIPLMTGFRMKLLATGLWKIRTTTRKQNVQVVIKLLGSLLVVAQPIFFQSKISISKTSGPVSTKNNHVNCTIIEDSAISSNQGTLDTFVTNFNSAKAEIIWF